MTDENEIAPPKERNTVFISHAYPQNNYFAGWLASKLKVLGYKVWVDLQDLRAGDSFNSVIEPIIKESAIVFLAITSVDYKVKASDQKSGVSRELNCADTVKLSHNFILPVKIDQIDYTNFPYHFQGWNAVNFHPNWQDGLVQLVKELEELPIPKLQTPENPFSIWFETIKARNKVINRTEKYLSNWFGIELPKKVFVHFPEDFVKEQVYSIPYPLTTESTAIISFTSKATTHKYIKLKHSFEYTIEEFFKNDDKVIGTDFTLKEPRKKLIRLLNNSFNLHCRNRRLILWEKGHKIKKKYFYFPIKSSTRQSVPLKRYNKSRRDLVGKTTQVFNGEEAIVNWHFTISASVDLKPWPHYKIFYSLTFTDKNFKRFEKDIHHKLRRSIPADWYNRKWLETLLAAILEISSSYESEFIRIQIDNQQYLLINNMPINGVSNIGYQEPNDAE